MMRLWLLFLLFATPLLASEQAESERSIATLASDASVIKAGVPFHLALHLVLKEGWHTYWKNPGESGLKPQFDWTLPNGFSLSEVVFPAPQVLKTADFTDYGYSKEVWFIATVTPPALINPSVTPIMALKARWLNCNNVCIPEEANLSLALGVGDEVVTTPSAEAIHNTLSNLPVALAEPIDFAKQGNEIHFTVPLGNIKPETVKSVFFFPDTMESDGKQHFLLEKGQLSLFITPSVNPLAGLVSLFLTNGERRDFTVTLGKAIMTATVNHPKTPETGLLFALISAFVGGLILNLMPCVFPILSLKAFAIAKKTEKDRLSIRLHGIAYTFGVCISFIALAFVLIGIQQAGHQAGWGYQMQSPPFVASLVLILFMVGLNLSGMFELPMLFGNVGAGVAAKDNAWGSFFTGMLAVLVATPCTAPFMAPAIGFALTQDATTIFCVFTLLGLGLAAPFLLISLFPRLIAFLPRSGSWLYHFKQLTAFPMYASALWLLWVLMKLAGIDAGIIVLGAALLIVLALWLMKLSWRFLAFIVFIASIAGALLSVQPSDIPVHEAFSIKKLAALRAEKKAILVDVTADWCITCKVNEHLVLSSAAIQERLKQKNVVYLVADWTKPNDEITQYLGSFGRSGVPLYVYYGAGANEAVILPQVLNQEMLLELLK